VFDKDNTLTLPYELQIHPTALEGLEDCRKIIGNIAILSNSIGSKDDKNYEVGKL
jgi:phosphatidylglycerophosphatase GEP4